MATKLVPTFIKRAIKSQIGFTRLQTQLNATLSEVQQLREAEPIQRFQSLQAQVDANTQQINTQLDNANRELQQLREAAQIDRLQSLQAQVDANTQQINKLRELYEYSVLRPIDLVQYEDNYYFWYMNDVSYPRSSVCPDQIQVLPPFPYSIQEFWESRYRDLRYTEQRAKFILLAYFWLHNIEFTMLDIGANVGTTAIPCGSFIRRFGKQNAIHSFEPGIVGNLFQNSIMLNGLGGLVHFEPRAVTNKTGAMMMHSWLRHSESNSLCDFRKHYPTLDLASVSLVPTVSVDDFVKEKGITDTLFVKIDAEGHDWPVIQGMSQALKNQVAALTFEFTPRYVKEFIEPAEMLRFFADDWYMLHTPALDSTSNWRCHGLNGANLQQFANAVDASPMGWVDIVLLSKKLPNLDALVGKLCI